MHQDLPSLHLSESVVQRTARRLRALYAGQTDAQLLRAVPTIFDYDKNIRFAVSNNARDTQDICAIPVKDEEPTLKHKKQKIAKTNKEKPTKSVDVALHQKLKSKWKENPGGKLRPPVVPVAVWEN